MEQTQCACSDAVIGMGPDESVLILIKHCRDMKQQETCLRLITLFLLLICTTLFLYTITGSTGHRSTEKQQPVNSQQRQCSEGLLSTATNHQRWHIRLRAVSGDNTNTKQYMKWVRLFGGEFNEEKHAIVIPESGVYFVYVKIDLSCPDVDKAANFFVELRSWNEGYNETQSLSKAWETVACNLKGFRTVIVQEVLNVIKGDYVSVWIDEGFNLITRSSFGAFVL